MPGRLWRLEALRGLAAFYVLLHHISSNYLKLKYTVWGFPFRFGLEAVVIFFILSGFVICYSHNHATGKHDDFKTYFIKRARRIYPIFVLSLLLAYGIACLSARCWVPVDFAKLLGNLCMLQDIPARPGIYYLPFADNMPLWSLSFEWWFYMMFYPINKWIPRPAQKYVVLALVVTGLLINQFHPNGICWFLVFFIIWWVGVEMAHEFRETRDVSLPRQKIMLVLICVPTVWYTAITWQSFRQGSHLAFNSYPLVELRYFLFTAVLFGLIWGWRQIQYAGFDGTIGRFYRLGSISYALYVFHYTIVCDLQLFSGTGWMFYFDLLLRVILVFFLAGLAEGVLQKWINKITNPLLTPDAKASMALQSRL